MRKITLAFVSFLFVALQRNDYAEHNEQIIRKTEDVAYVQANEENRRNNGKQVNSSVFGCYVIHRKYDR